MTTSLDSLNTLLEHAQSERDEALAALRQAEGRAQAAQQQHEQLVNYRGDYQKRWSQQFAQRGAIEILHCYQTFHDRLDQAITQQSFAATQCDSAVARARQLLLERELRVASVRKLIERRGQALQQQADRRDQKMTDEAAQRSGWNDALPNRLMSSAA
jgi:flagellar FliJ protein